MDLPTGKELAQHIEKEIKKGDIDGVAHWISYMDLSIRILRENHAYTPEMQKQVQQMMQSCNEKLHSDGYLPGLNITGQQAGNLTLIDKQHQHEYIMRSGPPIPSAEDDDTGYGYRDPDDAVRHGPVQVENKTDNYHDPVSKAYLDTHKK